jgi:cytoskeletal protein RodZ
MTTGSRRTLIVSASLLIAVVAAFVAWSWSSPNPQAPASARASTGGTSTPSASTAPTPSANTPSSTVPSAVPAAPPTPKGPSTVSASKPARVDVVTTFAGWNATSRAVEVGGYAAVVEPVGTCTLRLIHADKVVTRKNIATADATTVACGGFSVPGSALNAGQWQAVLAYTSSKSAGEAAAVTVKVP